MDRSAAFDAIPAAMATTRETRFVLLLGSLRWIIGGQWVEVQEAGFARVALFGDNHRDTDKLGLVCEQLDESGMGDVHKFLIVLAAQLHPLLPERILANDECADALLHRTYSKVLQSTPLILPGSPPDASYHAWCYFGLTPGPQAVFRLAVATLEDGMFTLRPNMRRASTIRLSAAFSSRSPI